MNGTAKLAQSIGEKLRYLDRLEAAGMQAIAARDLDEARRIERMAAMVSGARAARIEDWMAGEIRALELRAAAGLGIGRAGRR